MTAGGFGGAIAIGSSAPEAPSGVALPPHVCIAQRLAEILLLLDTMREEIYTEQRCSMFWMEDALELVSNEADWLMKLSV
jgi:hypothetical protein